MSPSLHVVDSDEPVVEPVAAKVRRLQAEAREAARLHVQAMVEAVVAVHATAIEIQAGGDAYPAGARALARDIAHDCERRRTALTALTLKAKT